MKKIVIILSLIFVQFNILAQSFQFAVISDCHIQTKDSSAYHLKKVIDDINNNKNIQFTLIAGDIVERADSLSFLKVKQIFELFQNPYYVIPGNHDTLLKRKYTDMYFHFFYKNFTFESNNVKFIGFSTAPRKIGKGNVDTATISFLTQELNKTPKNQTILLLTHYPLLSVDVINYKEITALLKKQSVQAVLCGHYHRNTVFAFDEIPGIVNRAIYRSSDESIGYNVYNINNDFLEVTEINLTRNESEVWLKIPIKKNKN